MSSGGYFGNPLTTGATLAPGAVGSTHLADGAVITSKLADLAVEAAKLQDLAVQTAKLDNAAVSTVKLQDLAVTTAKIGLLAVGNAQISDLSADKINAGSITALRYRTRDPASGNRVEIRGDQHEEFIRFYLDIGSPTLWGTMGITPTGLGGNYIGISAEGPSNGIELEVKGSHINFASNGGRMKWSYNSTLGEHGFSDTPTGNGVKFKSDGVHIEDAFTSVVRLNDKGIYFPNGPTYLTIVNSGSEKIFLSIVGDIVTLHVHTSQSAATHLGSIPSSYRPENPTDLQMQLNRYSPSGVAQGDQGAVRVRGINGSVFLAGVPAGYTPGSDSLRGSFTYIVRARGA